MAYFPDGRAGSVTRAFSLVRDTGLSLAAAVNAFVNRYEAGRTLYRLDDRMLADIGLTRADVESALLEPVWRDPTKRLAVIAVERRAAMRAARRAACDKETTTKTVELAG